MYFLVNDSVGYFYLLHVEKTKKVYPIRNYLYLKCRPAHVYGHKKFKIISFISITKTVCTSSGNYIPALTIRFETIINMTIRDRTI